jgi:hypothetical protein
VVLGTKRSVVQCATIVQAHHVREHGRPVTEQRGIKRFAQNSATDDADAVGDSTRGASSECEESMGANDATDFGDESTH